MIRCAWNKLILSCIYIFLAVELHFKRSFSTDIQQSSVTYIYVPCDVIILKDLSTINDGGVIQITGAAYGITVALLSSFSFTPFHSRILFLFLVSHFISCCLFSPSWFCSLSFFLFLAIFSLPFLPLYCSIN